MSLEVWYKDDIRRTVAALACSGQGRGPEYLAALEHVAIAFGVQGPGQEQQPSRWIEQREPVYVLMGNE